jgi:hypothetical protein
MSDWDSIHTSEQEQYFEWVSALIIFSKLPDTMTEDEIMEKIYRMHKCDTNQRNDLDFLNFSTKTP